MKQVFKNHECVYLWLEQTQQQGRNHSGYIRFEGDTLWITPGNLETPFARIIERKYVLIDIHRLLQYRGYARKWLVLTCIGKAYHKILFVFGINDFNSYELLKDRNELSEEMSTKAHSKKATDRHLLEVDRLEKEKQEFVQLVGAHVLMKGRMMP